MRAHCLWALLLLWLAPARAALEIEAQWKPDSPEAIAAAVDAQAFQVALMRDVAPVYDALGQTNAGVSVGVQATNIGTAVAVTTTSVRATTATPPPGGTAAPTSTPPPAQDPNGTPTIAVGAAVVGVAAFAALGLFTTNRAVLTVPAAREHKRGHEIPYRIERPERDTWRGRHV